MARVECEKRRRGRPRKEGSMQGRYHMMIGDDMKERLKRLSESTGLSQAVILREAFDIYEPIKLGQLSSKKPAIEDYEYDDYSYYDECDEGCDDDLYDR